jgi:hypothetical protein
MFFREGNMGYNETPTSERIVMEENRELSRELADKRIQIIEAYYPKFLADSGMFDGPSARVIFYTVMIDAARDDQFCPDIQAQDLVVDNLGVQLGIAHEDMLQDAKRRFEEK